MDIRRFILGGGAVLLLVALIGGVYALGRSDSSSEEPVSLAVRDTPAVPSGAATTRPSPSATSGTSPSASPTAANQAPPTLTPVVPTEPPAPTATPTSTSLPPTSTPAPVASTPGLGCSWSASCEFQPVSSEGKDSLDLLLLHTGASLLRITGHAGGHHFAVWGRDANGDRTTLFVNTTDPYVGTVPLNFDEPTARLEITAVGFWTVEVLPLSAARVADVPGIITGQSDDVVLISGTPGTTQIIGNADSRHFAVVSYGVFRDLLVNTTEPYDRRIGIRQMPSSSR